MKVPFLDLKQQWLNLKEEIKPEILKVFESGVFIGGEFCSTFEGQIQDYLKVRHAIGCNSGTDALMLALRACNIKPGDEVITTPFTFFATAEAVSAIGAIPIFVDIKEKDYTIDPAKIEEAISDKTRAIIPVHIFGALCDMDPIMEIAHKYKLKVIEDAAQAIGSSYKGRKAGTLGDVGCFSFYPTKNLGAFGDAGAVVTDDEAFADKLRMMRNYGSKVKYHNEIEGINSRLDEMQAALLRVKLSHLRELNDERKVLARRYNEGIVNPEVLLPRLRDGAESIYHQYVVRCASRDLLQKSLEQSGIQTQIHYPVPPHLADCYRYLGHHKGEFPITETYADEVLSLPIYTGMTWDEQDYVIEQINAWRV